MKKTKKTKTNAPNCDNLDCIRSFTCNWNPLWYLGRLLQWNYEHIKFLLYWRNAYLLVEWIIMHMRSNISRIVLSLSRDHAAAVSGWNPLSPGLRAATTVAQCHRATVPLCHWELPPLPSTGTIIARQSSSINGASRSIKDLVGCDASGGKQDGVDGCSKSVILWWKYWMTTEVI